MAKSVFFHLPSCIVFCQCLAKVDFGTEQFSAALFTDMPSLTRFMAATTKIVFNKNAFSRMRTARSSSRLLGGCLPQCMLGYTRWVRA